MTDRREGSATSKTGRTGDYGFILIPVLLALSILGLVAVTLTRTVSIDLKIEAILLRHAEAEALADGIARLTIQYLVVNGPGSVTGSKFRLDGSPVACQIEGDTASISVLDTAGQIDINFASIDILQRLFVGIGLSTEDATILGAAVIDFRDLDDIMQIGGLSEAAAYQQAGLSHGPKNAPFATVGELDQVLGMTPEIMARVRPLVTVYSHMRAIDPTVASPAVLALPLPTLTVPRNPLRSYVIRAAVRHRGNIRFMRETIVELTSRAPSGFLVKEWNRVDDDTNAGIVGDDDAASCLDILKTDQ